MPYTQFFLGYVHIGGYCTTCGLHVQFILPTHTMKASTGTLCICLQQKGLRGYTFNYVKASVRAVIEKSGACMLLDESRPLAVRSSPWVGEVAIGTSMGAVGRVNTDATPNTPLVHVDTIGA